MPKIIKRLTHADIANAKPKDKPYKLYDEGGLRLLVRPTGTKTWQVPYTLNSTANTYTIGKYDGSDRAGFVGLKEARQARDEIKRLVKAGINPNKAKTLMLEEQSVSTFENIAREWHSKGIWSEAYSNRILSSLEKNIFPIFGYKQIDQIAPKEVIFALSRIEDRGALDVAKRVCQRCECVFDYAINKGICETNPASGRGKFLKVHQVQHYPHLKERELSEFLNKLDHYHGREYIKIAMQLLMMTFVRPGELRGAKWEEISISAATWSIPEQRMKSRKEHIVPLSTQAIRLLIKLRTITGNNEYLFPGLHSTLKPISDVTLLKVLKILGYVGDKKIVPHGFRHTASTILNENGFNSDYIEKQLAHIDRNRIRGTYNRAEYLDERRRMMQWYADYLDNMKNQYVGNPCPKERHQ